MIILHSIFYCRDIGVIQLRNNLVFIIDNLQYYLQVDVVESQYTTMEASMKNTQNFEDIQKAHSVFLANVMSQTFLLSSGIGKKNPVSSVKKLLHIKCKIINITNIIKYIIINIINHVLYINTLFNLEIDSLYILNF